MTLVDTSVWVEHYRRGNSRLRSLLEQGDVAVHALVIAELMCGDLGRNRLSVLHQLRRLPGVATLPDSIVAEALEAGRWWGRGIGWIDFHLALAARAAGLRFWTLDRRLAEWAEGIGLE